MVVHVQTPLLGVASEDGGSGGLVLVTPSPLEGHLRLSWPTRLIGPTLDELLSRSKPCVLPTHALEGRRDHEDDHEEELGKRMRSALTLASPHAETEAHMHMQAHAAEAEAQMLAQAQPHMQAQWGCGMTAGETESDADPEECAMSCPRD